MLQGWHVRCCTASAASSALMAISVATSSISGVPSRHMKRLTCANIAIVGPDWLSGPLRVLQSILLFSEAWCFCQAQVPKSDQVQVTP